MIIIKSSRAGHIVARSQLLAVCPLTGLLRCPATLRYRCKPWIEPLPDAFPEGDDRSLSRVRLPVHVDNYRPRNASGTTEGGEVKVSGFDRTLHTADLRLRGLDV